MLIGEVSFCCWTHSNTSPIGVTVRELITSGILSLVNCVSPGDRRLLNMQFGIVFDSFE